ncbi:uncharacterized protein LOC143226836 isoform X1 [Tachypleus tridentatus]|uniref:uncharacterized protein LOC143226836 isoform X1 n=1 Tax=Tachypleus tridentatus TaxID=6853 RepID=UPI003FD62C51
MQIVNKLKKIIISMSICFAHGPSGDVFILLQIQFYASRQKTLLPFELAQDRKYPFAKQRGDMPVGESETRESDVASETEGASPSVSGTKNPRSGLLKNRKPEMCKCIWSVFWFFVLIFIGYPIAFFFAEWYVLLCPLGACCDGCSGIIEFLLKLTQLPLICTRNMCEGKSIF